MARTIPIKDGEFINWSKGFTVNCSEHMETWKLDKVIFTALVALVTKAENAYKTHMDPMKTGRATTAAKNLAFAEAKAALSSFIKKMEVNDNISDEEIEGLGLQPRKHVHHRPIPVPGESPNLVAASTKHYDIDLYVSIPEEGRPARYMKKKGFHGVLIRYQLEGSDHWREKPSTKLRVSLVFDEKQVGKRLLVTASWLNPRLQNGPWSDPLSLLIN
jgi:hypothetical protein